MLEWNRKMANKNGTKRMRTFLEAQCERSQRVREWKREQTECWKTWKLVSLVFSAGNCFDTICTLEGSVTQDVITGFSAYCKICHDCVCFCFYLLLHSRSHATYSHVIRCTNSQNEPKTCFIIIYSPLFEVLLLFWLLLLCILLFAILLLLVAFLLLTLVTERVCNIMQVNMLPYCHGMRL